MQVFHSHFKNGRLFFANLVSVGNPEASHYTATQTWKENLDVAQAKGYNFGTPSFGNELKCIAEHIAHSKREEIYTLTLDGFDTHQFRKNRHDDLLSEYAEGLDGFIKALKSKDHFQGTLILTWSEFGRKLAQNNRKGTDCVFRSK